MHNVRCMQVCACAACCCRRNTYNGRVYKEDPTILAWDLLNEPRESSGNYGNVQTWIDMMASFLKAQDPNHMVGHACASIIMPLCRTFLHSIMLCLYAHTRFKYWLPGHPDMPLTGEL